MNRLKQVTPPAVPPVSLAEAKQFLRLETADEDALIGALIATAVERCEDYTGRALITQTWRLVFDAWPGPAVSLVKAPLLAVDHIKTFAADDSAQTLDPAAYFVDRDAAPGRVVARAGQAWPVPGRASAGIEIQFQAGYGANWNQVPQALRSGLLALVATFFERRLEPAGGALPQAVTALWHPYRIIRL
jgi:uncharacterized phiE125 gp8 family phage protein